MFATKSSPQLPYVCARCLRHQNKRRYVSTTASHPPAPPSSGAARLTTRRLISLHGPEASKFLQGIITNNTSLASRSGLFAAFLTAQGKVLNDVFIYPTHGSRWHSEVNKDEEHGYLVEVDAGDVSNLLRHVKRHKLRAKLAIRLLEDGELDVWSAWREDDRWTPHTHATGDGSAIRLTDSRAPGMGQRILVPRASSASGPVGQSSALDGVGEAALSAYTIRRYLRGVAEGQKEIPREETLPMNANIDIMGGIDFKKGCYVGQELTIRTHHTGVVRRRILPVQIYDASSSAPEALAYDSGTALPIPDDPTDIMRAGKKRSTGRLIASVGNIGLGMCRLEQMTDLIISGEPSSYTSNDKFVIHTADGEDLGVKAFVPDWMRGRIRGPKAQKRVE